MLSIFFAGLRGYRPDLKVLFITGFDKNAAIGNGHLEPGMEVITKPFVMAELDHRDDRTLIARPIMMWPSVKPPRCG